ncbi:hypothetical protein N7456_000394 [Penicillium angulare]|uniref:Uncharacterized protein n=1 Tax=Penicillium angulare TaxID=116970 RepID=A0A9W9GCF9_9EURO|nr:hypothetical protein N7456_000394 [Penicillium angulare]
MSEEYNFMVVTCFSSGARQAHEPGSREYTYLAYSSRLVIDLLSTSQARQCLTRIALEYDRVAFRSSLFIGDPRRAQYYIDLFLRKISQRFPAIIIDEGIQNPDILAMHERSPWSGTYEQFDARMQSVILNASKVYGMINAGRLQESEQVFWRYHFLLATAMAHEIGGHILITFLGQGRKHTPRTIGAPGYLDADGITGEAGRNLEMQLFGGTIEYYQSSNQRTQDTGVPHIVTARGRKLRIHDDMFRNFFHRRFQFPLQISSETTGYTRNMGDGFPREQHGPSERCMMSAERSDKRVQRMLAGFNVRIRDVYNFPQNTRALLRAF